MTAYTAGYFIAILLIYGLISRLVLWLVSRKSSSRLKVLLVHAVFGSFWTSSIRTSNAYTEIAGMCVIASLLIWLGIDLWRVRKPAKSKVLEQE